MSLLTIAEAGESVMTTESADAMSLLTIAEAGAALGCSPMHVYRLIAAGELSAVDIAQPGARRSKTRVRSDEVSAYIEARTRRARRGRVPAV
jgi:excisionase family DNA binding protein